MEVKVRYKCLDTGETGTETIVVVDWENKCVRDLKYAIQDVIHAPVCDQKLSHRQQLISTDSMPLLRTYHRQGETFSLEFPARANISEMKRRIEILKNHSQNLEAGATIKSVMWSEHFVEDDDLDGLSHFFTPWKNATAVAQRHYFVQEGGFDAFSSIFKASRLTLTVNEVAGHKEKNPFEARPPTPASSDHQTFQDWMRQVEFQSSCLSLIWLFCETGPDRKFAIQKGLLPLVIDAFVFEPAKSGFLLTVTKRFIQEQAVGCVAGLVEYDAESQLAAAGNTALIEKLITMADLRSMDTDTGSCSLFSRQVASNTLCYCAFNPASIPVLVKLGVHEKGVHILRDLLSKNKDVPLTYYWCMFLARLRSSHLVQLGKQTNRTIDELITVFVGIHQPSEITRWEVEKSYVWMSMTPLVHLALAGGRPCSENTQELWSEGGQQGHIPSEGSCNIDLIDHQPSGVKLYCGSEVSCSNDDSVVEATDLCAEKNPAKKIKLVPGSTAEEKLQDASITSDSASERITHTCGLESENQLMQYSPENQATWPGSRAIQRLGLFILEHMLFIEENRSLFLSEGLLPYAIYLSWVLRVLQERECMKKSLARFKNVSIPSLKDLAKSVLAQMHGLDFAISMKV